MIINKEKTDEKQLLADAKRWFEQQHGGTPKECGIKFIKIWHKPTIFKKTTAVVFAPTKEAGEAFIREQNAVWHAIRNFWIIPIVFISILEYFVFTGDIRIFIPSCILCFFAILLMLYLGMRCKKLEKIHKWDVDVYYP